jgi:hypothetical protein
MDGQDQFKDLIGRSESQIAWEQGVPGGNILKDYINLPSKDPPLYICQPRLNERNIPIGNLHRYTGHGDRRTGIAHQYSVLASLDMGGIGNVKIDTANACPCLNPKGSSQIHPPILCPVPRIHGAWTFVWLLQVLVVRRASMMTKALATFASCNTCLGTSHHATPAEVNKCTSVILSALETREWKHKLNERMFYHVIRLMNQENGISKMNTC